MTTVSLSSNHLCQSVEFLLVSRKCNIARGKHSKRENSSPRASACCCAITIGEKGGGGRGTKGRTKRTKRRTRECAFGQGDPDGLQQAPRRRRQLQLHLLRRKEGNSLAGTIGPCGHILSQRIKLKEFPSYPQMYVPCSQKRSLFWYSTRAPTTGGQSDV